MNHRLANFGIQHLRFPLEQTVIFLFICLFFSQLLDQVDSQISKNNQKNKIKKQKRKETNVKRARARWGSASPMYTSVI